MPKHPLGEELFPNNQAILLSATAPAQLHAILSSPTTAHQREEISACPSASSDLQEAWQAGQAQLFAGGPVQDNSSLKTR